MATVVKTITEVPVESIEPYDSNPRWISEQRFEDLKRSMTQDRSMLLARPVIVDATGVAVAGNMRLRAAQALGWDTIPAVVVEFEDEAERTVWVLKDNVPFGEWQDDLLAEAMYGLKEAGVDLDRIGMPEGQVQLILDGVSPGPSEFPELGDDLATEFCCPRCNYEWSGAPKPKAIARAGGDDAAE